MVYWLTSWLMWRHSGFPSQNNRPGFTCQPRFSFCGISHVFRMQSSQENFCLYVSMLVLQWRLVLGIFLPHASLGNTLTPANLPSTPQCSRMCVQLVDFKLMDSADVTRTVCCGENLVVVIVVWATRCIFRETVMLYYSMDRFLPPQRWSVTYLSQAQNPVSHCQWGTRADLQGLRRQ